MSGKLQKILAKFKMKAYYIMKGHILNPLWGERGMRKANRNYAMRNSILLYLHRYKKKIASLTPGDFSPILPSPANLPEINKEYAFSIWLQGEDSAPDIVKACFRSMRRKLNQELIILDEKTVFDIITLPDYIVEKWKAGHIRPAHFTDICRVELLYKYGGVWIDSTDFITSPVPKEIMDADFFMFLAGEKVAAWFSFVQNCFIRARKGDPLLGYWREAIFTYWKNEDRTVNYFVHQLIFRFTIEHNNQAKSLFNSMPHIDQDPTHILWFEHKDDPFDRENYLKWTEPTFFQKTTYRDERAIHPHPGTMADHIIHSR